MQRSLAMLLAAALVAPAGLLASETTGPTPAAAGPRPRAVVEVPVADLGTVPKGEKAAHDFVIKNEGDAPLEINEVRPACGCTVAQFDKVIPPGGTGKVHAELDTTGIAGASSKSISVFSNDPATPRIELTLLVKVADFLVFNPGFARFLKGHGHPPGVISQIFYTPDFEGLAIERVESPVPYLKVEYRDAKPEELRQDGKSKQYVFTLTLDYDQAPVGPLGGQIVVHTNHPKQPVGRLSFSGFVRPLVAVTPPVADFGDVDPADGPKARFLVHNFGAQKLRVTAVDSPLPGATVGFETVEEGIKYTVDLTLPEEMPKGPFSTQLKIHTDNPGEPVLVVPVTGKVL